MILGEYGFMVLVWLRGLREFRTKIAQPPRPSPPPQPRDSKIEPKPVPTIHEGGKWETQFQHKAPAHRNIRVLQYFLRRAGKRTYLIVQGVWVAFSYFPRLLLLSSNSSGVYCAEYAERPISLLIAGLVSLLSAGVLYVILVIRAWLPQRCRSNPSGSCLWLAWVWSPVNFWQAPFGVCGLLALPIIHQIFGDSLAEFPHESACRGVDFLLLRGVSSGNVVMETSDMARCGPPLGELSGGNWISCCAVRAFSLSRVITWVASASPCLVQLAPFGGSACVRQCASLR